MFPALLAALALGTSSPLAVQNKIQTAISEEKVALDFLGDSPNWTKARDWIQRSDISLQQAKGFLKDETTVHPGDEATITKNIDTARHDDAQALAAVRAKNAAKAKAALERALAAKHVAFIAVAQYTEQKATRCEVEKAFQVFAVPEGYAGSYADVFPHVPKGAKGIHVTFIDVATGKAPAAEVFPGQTWKATTKGFLPNGKFDVRIDVSGTGFGKPDANAKNWKVIVTYDCP